MEPRTVPPTRAEQKAATQAAILNAAVEVFAEHGFEGATMREVAERSGVKQPLIVYHFASKDSLWQAAVDTVWERLQARVIEGVGGPSPSLEASFAPGVARPEALREFIAAVLRAFAAEPAYMRIVLREAGSDSERFGWLATRHMEGDFQASMGVLGLAREAGLVPTGVSVGHLVYAFAGALFFPFAVAADVRRNLGQDPSDPQFIESYADTLTLLLSAHAPGARP